MRTVERQPDRLTLAGIPHGAGWLCFGITLGVIFLFAFGWLCVESLRRADWIPAAMTAIGASLGAIFIAVCTDLFLQRERLDLDRALRRGVYRHWSLLRGEIKSFEFPFDRIAAVSIEKAMQSPGGGKGFPTQVLRCRLLLTRPRRAILLDETQNHRYPRIRALTDEVAFFLNTEVRQMGRWDEDAPAE